MQERQARASNHLKPSREIDRGADLLLAHAGTMPASHVGSSHCRAGFSAFVLGIPARQGRWTDGVCLVLATALVRHAHTEILFSLAPRLPSSGDYGSSNCRSRSRGAPR